MKNLQNNDLIFFFWTLGHSPVTAAQGAGGLSVQVRTDTQEVSRPKSHRGCIAQNMKSALLRAALFE